MSTILSDTTLDVFHHSITDLGSFSNSLDMNSHLPSADEREEFLAEFMCEEEINPTEQDSFQSSFAYDLQKSIPTKLGTILDDYFSEGEDEDEHDNHMMHSSLLTTTPTQRVGAATTAA